MFRNYKFRKNTLYEAGLDDYFMIPLCNDEEEDVERYPNLIINKLEECLKHVNPGFDCDDSPVFLDFVESYYKCETKLKELEGNIYNDILIKEIKKFWNLF